MRQEAERGGNMERAEACKSLESLAGVEAMEFVAGAVEGFSLDQGRVIFTTTKAQHFQLTRRAYLTGASKLGIPKAYASKTPINLMIDHFNYWLSASKKTYQLVYRRQEGMNRAIAFTAPNVEVFSPVGVLENIEDAVGRLGDLDYRIVQPTFDFVHIGVLGPKQMDIKDAKRGDILRGGVTFTGAYDGSLSPEIATYVERVECTNGLVSSQNLFRWSRRHMSTAFDAWVSEMAVLAWSGVEAQFDLLGNAMNITFGAHLSVVLQSIFSTFNVPVWTQDLITNRIIDRGAETMFDVINEIGWVSAHLPEDSFDPRIVRRLQQAAGGVSSHQQICKTCHRIL